MSIPWHHMITSLLIVHLEVHHVYQERGPEYQHFGVHRKPLVVSNLKVVSVRERFPETTIPLLGDDGQRGAVRVEDVEDDVIVVIILSTTWRKPTLSCKEVNIYDQPWLLSSIVNHD